MGSRNAVQINSKDWDTTVTCLHKKWGPEQIADQVGISHETIYRHVYVDKVAGGSLYQQLRCQKKRKKCAIKTVEVKLWIEGRSVSPREHMKPDFKSVISRGDTVIGAVHKQVVVTLVERKSGYALMAKVSNKTSDLVSQAIITKLNVVTPLVKTLTFDNGKKFAEHARIDRVLKSITYFADPFASLQRGSNENFNGLLRKYAPKRRPLSTVTDKELRMNQVELNSRPRKRLGFKLPMKCLCSL